MAQSNTCGMPMNPGEKALSGPADVGEPSVELPQIPRIVFHSRILPIVPTGVKHIPSQNYFVLRHCPSSRQFTLNQRSAYLFDLVRFRHRTSGRCLPWRRPSCCATASYSWWWARDDHSVTGPNRLARPRGTAVTTYGCENFMFSQKFDDLRRKQGPVRGEA